MNFHVFIHAYSLRTADVFPVVASLSSPIFRRERSDYWKCVYCSLALNFHVFIHAYSLRTADVFPVVASLSSPIFRRERSDYWKCVYCSLAWVPEAFHVQFPVLVKSSKVTCFAAHVFSLRPKTCRPVADKTKLPVTHKKKPLVPRVTVYGLTSA